MHRVWRAPETAGRGAGAALRLARPPGRRRRGRSLSLRRPAARCCAARTRCSSPSTRSRTRATSAPSAARPRSPAPPGWSIPERRAAEVTAAACKASAGAVEHLPVARVRNLADWLGGGEGRRASGSGAPTPAPSGRPGTVDLTRPDGPRPRRRGEGHPPARRRRLRRPGRAAAARAGSTRSTSRRPPRRCSSRPSASAADAGYSAPVATATAVARTSQFGVDRTPPQRVRLTAPTRVNLSLSLRLAPSIRAPLGR